MSGQTASQGPAPTGPNLLGAASKLLATASSPVDIRLAGSGQLPASQARPDAPDARLERAARRAFEAYETWTGGRRAWAGLSEERKALWRKVAETARRSR